MTGDTDSDDLEVAWPSAHHDLRGIGPNWQHLAGIGWQKSNPYGAIKGYWRAAEVIAEHISRDQHDNDVLIFPFCMCWRHHIELRLKDLLPALQQLLDLPIRVPAHHKIQNLWADVKPLIIKAHGKDDTSGTNHASRILTQLAELDADGQEFRYTRRRDGQPTLPNVHHIDMSAFHAAMCSVANFLDAVDTATDAALDSKHEMMDVFLGCDPEGNYLS